MTVLAACIAAKARACAASAATRETSALRPETNGAVGTPEMNARIPVSQILEWPMPMSPIEMASPVPSSGSEGSPRRAATQPPSRLPIAQNAMSAPLHSS